MVRRILLAGLAVGLTVGAVGCRHCCRHHHRDLPPRGGFLGDPAVPRNGDLIPAPPGGLPSTPPAADPGPPRASDPLLPPPTISDNTRNFRPGGPQLLLPDPLPGTSSSRRLGDPVRPAAGGVVPAGHTEPAVPGFAVVKPGLAGGRKPAVEGFDALTARGYRTAVYLHAPGDDVSAVKDLAGKKGLAFVGIPVSAETVKPAFERFREAVADAPARPAFVFDDDGVRAGGLWYLYFRAVDQLGDDAARVRAAPLGLREASGDLWAAIQDYLARR